MSVRIIYLALFIFLFFFSNPIYCTCSGDCCIKPDEELFYKTYDNIAEAIDLLEDGGYLIDGACPSGIYPSDGEMHYVGEYLMFGGYPLMNFGVSLPMYPESTISINLLGFFLYTHFFLHLFVLGFIFLIVIIGVISLLLNRNLRVKRQAMFLQQTESILQHITLRKCT